MGTSSHPAGAGTGTAVPAGQADRGRTAASWTPHRKLDIHLPEQLRPSRRSGKPQEVPPPKPVPDTAVPGTQNQVPGVPAPQASRAVRRMVLLPPLPHLNPLQMENLTAQWEVDLSGRAAWFLNDLHVLDKYVQEGQQSLPDSST